MKVSIELSSGKIIDRTLYCKEIPGVYGAKHLEYIVYNNNKYALGHKVTFVKHRNLWNLGTKLNHNTEAIQ